MKVEQKTLPPKFDPIIITLESQEEVDTLYAILSNVRIVPNDSVLTPMFNGLLPHQLNYKPHYDSLMERTGLGGRK